MMNIRVFSAFFAFYVAVTSAGVISSREDEARENYRKLAFSNNELAFNLHRRLVSESSDNVFFSPLSISTAFGMLFYGTRGSAAEELREALGYERADLPDYLVHNIFNHYLRKILKSGENSDGYVLNAANAIFVDKRVELLDEYRHDVQEFYRAAVRDVDFRREAPRIVDEINDYVREQTNGKIQKLFEELSPSTVLLLLNAVYFKGAWKTEFEPEKTRYETFYNHGLESEGRRVPLMHTRSQFPYASFDNFQALELPYYGENVSMLIFLPNQRDGLQDLEENFTPEKLADVHHRLHRTKVDVSFPKFKLQFEKELSPEFQALGAHQIFRNGADFSGMTHSRNIAVSQIVHRAVIEVNEQGSEAAAVTGIGVVGTSAILETPQFRADHPFLFAFVEKGSESNMILFLGRINRL